MSFENPSIPTPESVSEEKTSSEEENSNVEGKIDIVNEEKIDEEGKEEKSESKEVEDIEGRNKAIEELLNDLSRYCNEKNFSEKDKELLKENVQKLVEQILDKDRSTAIKKVYEENFSKASNPRHAFYKLFTENFLNSFKSASENTMDAFKTLSRSEKITKSEGNRKFQEGENKFHALSNSYEGVFMGALQKGGVHGALAIKALEEIARLNNQEASEVIEDHREIIEGVVKNFRSDWGKIKDIEEKMNGYGYKYNHSEGKYVKN
jgi:hypothetical protein